MKVSCQRGLLCFGCFYSLLICLLSSYCLGVFKSSKITAGLMSLRLNHINQFRQYCTHAEVEPLVLCFQCVVSS